MAINWSEYTNGTQVAPLIVKSVDEAPVLGPELWAALVGAAVAGIIGVITQYIVIWDNKKRQDQERREIDITLARALTIKTLRIHSSFFSQLKYIVDSKEDGEKHGGLMRHQSMRPLANLPEVVEFKPEELALVSRLKGSPLLDEFMSLDTRHNSSIQLWGVYKDSRRELDNMLKPMSFEGIVGTVMLEEEEAAAVKGHMVALDDLIAQMEVLLWDYFRETTTILEEVLPAINAKFGTKFELKFKDGHEAAMERVRLAVEVPRTGSQNG